MANFNFTNLIGKSEDEVSKELQKSNFKTRVRMRNGKGIMGTCDYRADRVNLYVQDGKVTNLKIG